MSIPFTERRRFLGGLAATSALAVLERPLALSQPVEDSQLAHDPERPQFHLLPAKNWMNDPNGPIYFAGKYHMFFQYNPQGAIWGNMSWYHATSPDMLYWTHEPLAFTMSPNSADAAGCFSGSCIATDEDGHKRVYAIYTGVVRDKQRETIRNEGLSESQCLAWSDDPRLLRWTKMPQPVVPSPPAGLQVTGFRDPSVWKEGAWFYMTVGSGIEKTGGCVLLYRSKDLRSWEYLHQLTSGQWDGKPTSNPVNDGEMWECPEFFPLDGGHVLIYSTTGKVFWQSGAFDAKALTFRATKTGLLDLDAFYAPKTQVDAQGRRILWGWIPERRSEAEMQKAGWSGMISLPRVMNLDPDGTLRLKVLPTFSSLRGAQIKAEAQGSALTLPKANGEFLCVGSRNSGFDLSVTAAGSPLLRLQYLPNKHIIVAEDKEVQLGPDDLPEIHAFVDGSVLEIIVAQRVGYTKRFYYSEASAPSIRFQLKGQELKPQAWTITPISANRLTTS